MLFSHWPIRNKLQLGLGLLAVSVLTLFGSAYYGLYAYRGLVKSLSARSAELPLANELSQHVADLRVILSQVEERLDYAPGGVMPFGSALDQKPWAPDLLRELYRTKFELFCQTLEKYREQLDGNRMRTDTRIGDDRHERATLLKIDAVLARIEQQDDDQDGVGWLLENDETRSASSATTLNRCVSWPPNCQAIFMLGFTRLATEVRTQYRMRNSAGLGHDGCGHAAAGGGGATVPQVDRPAAGHAGARLARSGRRKIRPSHPPRFRR